VETLPRDMVIKAMWYVDHKSTHFHTAKDRNGDIFTTFWRRRILVDSRRLARLTWQRMLTLAKAYAMLLATPRRDSLTFAKAFTSCMNSMMTHMLCQISTGTQATLHAQRARDSNTLASAHTCWRRTTSWSSLTLTI
jgi:hypothetical protein